MHSFCLVSFISIVVLRFIHVVSVNNSSFFILSCVPLCDDCAGLGPKPTPEPVTVAGGTGGND